MLQVIAASLEIWRDGLLHCTAAKLWSHGGHHALQMGAPAQGNTGQGLAALKPEAFTFCWSTKGLLAAGGRNIKLPEPLSFAFK